MTHDDIIARLKDILAMPGFMYIEHDIAINDLIQDLKEDK
jgi:hypothetical protein